MCLSNKNESHNIRLGGIKPNILDFKNNSTLSRKSLKSNVDENQILFMNSLTKSELVLRGV